VALASLAISLVIQELRKIKDYNQLIPMLGPVNRQLSSQQDLPAVSSAAFSASARI
jgi:hypothetical protein